MALLSQNGNGYGKITLLPPTTTTKTIDGRSLAHRDLSKPQLAIIAADIYDGRLRFNPTQRQVADICGVSLSYVRFALALPPDVRVPANVRPPRRMTVRAVNYAISDVELVKAIRAIGVNRVLDAAVAAEAAE
jgi:hypothetical protein